MDMAKEEQGQTSSLPPQIGKPALRALAGAGITSLPQLAGMTEAEFMGLHGTGPKSLRLLQEALAAEDLSFKE
jgi:hypothetical protein